MYRREDVNRNRSIEESRPVRPAGVRLHAGICEECIWLEVDEDSERCVNRHLLCCDLHMKEQFSSGEPDSPPVLESIDRRR